jgi:crotonobetainyl-CoA:carnitine CoA-transferase CaiB-like acyl-CoA transferase
LSVGDDKFYSSLCTVLRRPDLIEDPRFVTGLLRYANRKEWDLIAEPIFAQWSLNQLLAELDGAGVPAGAVNTYTETFADPHVVHRGIRRTMTHPLGRDGQISIVANPCRLSRTPPAYDRRPPMLGEHTDAVLREWLSLDEDAIERLRAAAAI